MITLDPRLRYRNAQEAATATREVADLLRRGARAIGPRLRQRCDFCKQGFYGAVDMSGPGYENFVGTKHISVSQWRIMVCDECGHVQWFRIEKAKQRSTWWST
jgi:hypothetical protein